MSAAHTSCPESSSPGWDDPIPYVLTELGKAAVQQIREKRSGELGRPAAGREGADRVRTQPGDGGVG